MKFIKIEQFEKWTRPLNLSNNDRTSARSGKLDKSHYKLEFRAFAKDDDFFNPQIKVQYLVKEKFKQGTK